MLEPTTRDDPSGLEVLPSSHTVGSYRMHMISNALNRAYFGSATAFSVGHCRANDEHRIVSLHEST